ncbi:reticulophagy regulator 3 isoform X1 [Pelobates cultripes]|uniref:Reticulophagy regulator 3 isoform X1 n=1 Tax=Pelobates cultripes TaxID=61616 RepID=A0AAD1SJY2_PELCU|nr:reticulophagy regulator 3 isoform X1 [Pelobates cultripes]
MAQRAEEENSSGLRSRRSGARSLAARERDEQVQAVQDALLQRLGSYEPVLSYLQAVLVWERPRHSALLHLGLNAAFWFFALTSLRILFLVAFGLMIIICVDQWKNKIWPELGAARPNELDNESWGFVHPRLLSVPELCHYAAETWVTFISFLHNLLFFKTENPGKFCLLICGFLTFLTVLGGYIPGLVLSYLLLLFILLWPLAIYHRLGQRVYQKLEPALQRLDFSVRGYMMAKQKEREMHGRALPSNEASDSEEELAAFCPTLDDSMVAKELTISDSEHSDAEVSYTENGTFNLSRGQTPLTEGSEDLDRHSDPEESFARDLPDFPSINPEALGIDDEDDTSIGIPSRANHPRLSSTQLYDEQESEADMSLGGFPGAQQITDNIAGLVTRGMIQLALAGATQQASTFLDNPRAKTYQRNSSSELDTDAEADDFELLDQSELSQMDPVNQRGHQ